jgi:hypothetical protein
LTNGGVGFIGHWYRHLWPVGELLGSNRDYQVEVNAPGIFLFGSDGGGEGLGFDRRTSDFGVVMIPFIPMDAAECRPVARSFFDFLSSVPPWEGPKD